MRQRVRKAIILVSLLLFPITMNYLSPYVPIDGASQGVLAFSLVLFAALFLSSLVIGRAWCAWLCPAGGLAEACMAVNNRPVNRRRLRVARYIVWGIWACALIAVAISAGGIHRVDLLHLTENGFSVDEPMKYAMYLMVLGILTAAFFAIGRRGMCHAFCWMAPFMEAGNSLSRALGIPHLHIAATPRTCNGCGACSRKCPMSIDVKAQVPSGAVNTVDCILCGECVDTCPKKTLRYAVGSVRPAAAAKAPSSNAR